MILRSSRPIVGVSLSQIGENVRAVGLALLVLLLGLAFLSAAVAASLGLQTGRILTFVALVGSLGILAAAAQSRLPVRHEPMALALLALLGVLGLQNIAHDFDPIEYKVALPVLALLIAPRVALLLAEDRRPAKSYGWSCRGTSPSRQPILSQEVPRRSPAATTRSNAGTPPAVSSLMAVCARSMCCWLSPHGAVPARRRAVR